MTQIFSIRLPDNAVLEVPEAGHYPQSQQPTEVAEAVVRFLERAVDRA